VCLLAGRYSLIDRSAADGVLDRLLARQIGVVLGGVFNSGILAAPPEAEATFDYAQPPAAILARVQRVRAVCDRHGVPLAAAALQFPLRHPATSSILIGARNTTELTQCLAWAETPIPPELWGEIDTALATEAKT
jgi:D-threo-aldose 1-dehydrogenase